MAEAAEEVAPVRGETAAEAVRGSTWLSVACACSCATGAEIVASGMAVATSSFFRRWAARYGGSWDPISCRINGQAVVLGFLSHRDEDLIDVCPH
jgi:hypothetical protein